MQEETFGFEEDFQKGVVAAVLKDPVFLQHYDDVILPQFFDYEYLTSLTRIARELTDRLGQVPSKMTMIEETKEYCLRFNIASSDREFILSKLEEIYTYESYDPEYIKTKVVSFGQRQAIRSAVLKIVTLFKSDKSKNGSVDEATHKAKELLENALRIGLETRDMGISLYPILEKLPDLAAKSSSGMDKKVPTGIPTVDKYTKGGPNRGEVRVIMGLPGQGKSRFVVNMGVSCLKNLGQPVVHFTIGDLDKIDVGVRYAARLTGATTGQVISRDPYYMRKAKIMAKYNPHLIIKDYPSGTVTMTHLRAFVSKLVAVENIRPALIIIDYPEELKPLSAHNDSLYMQGGDNYSAMNAMAREFDSLIWAPSQPTRWMPKKPTDVMKGQDIGESWKKIQKADGVFSWNCTFEEKIFGRARLWNDKDRRHKSHYIVNMEFDEERMYIREAKPEEEDD